MTEIAFTEEKPSDSLMREIAELASAHYEETIDDDAPPKIDGSFYKPMYDQGTLRVFTARNGSLVGYSVFLVIGNRHKEGEVSAMQDAVYLKPDFRKGDTGLKFMRHCEDALIAHGVSVLYQFTSAKKDISPLLKRMGYRQTEVVYTRRV